MEKKVAQKIIATCLYITEFSHYISVPWIYVNERKQ